MAVDLDNVQGNILAGFNTAFQCFLCLRVNENTDVALVQNWVGRLADEVATFSRVKSQRKAIRNSNANQNMTWVMVAFGFEFLKLLRPDAIFLSRPFRNGFRSRARGVMGDHTDKSTWKVGGNPETEVDILLIIAGNNRDTVEAKAEELEIAAVQSGMKKSYREMGIRLEDEKEHFGFRDGIAQPKVDLDNSGKGLPPGQFIFGHQDIDGLIPNALHLQHPAELNSDGTLISFRRLHQDVKEFRSFRDAQVEILQTEWPEVTAEHLEALIVGRWPKGQLVSTSESMPGSEGTDIDDFNFSNDQMGLSCPLGSHIRKVNPRRGSGDLAQPEAKRFLRRGIPFGPEYTEDTSNVERGLLFIAMQSRIEQQVDFVTQIWMNANDRPNNDLSNDILVGRHFMPEAGNIKIKRGDEVSTVKTETNRWVTPSGGAYLFAPSIEGLRALGQSPAGVVGWRVRAATGQVRNAISDLFESSRENH